MKSTINVEKSQPRRARPRRAGSGLARIGLAALAAGLALSPQALAQGGVASPTCYADCDLTTGQHVIDVFDFLCFQNAFAAGDPYACECDVSTGGGVCDIFDFLCYQNAWSCGCPPLDPANLRVTDVYRFAADMRWDDRSNPPSVQEDGFNIAISTDGVNFNRAETVGRNTTVVRLDGLQPATVYYVKVRGWVESCGTRQYSGYTNTVQLRTHSDPVGPVDASMSDVWSFAADLRWTDRSDDEGGYNGALSTDGSNFNGPFFQTAAVPGTGGRGVGRYENLQPSTRYWAKVRAFRGPLFSDYSNTVEFTTRPFNAPTNLHRCGIGRFHVDLCWNDNSDNEHGFRIARSTDGVNFNNIHVTGPDATSYRDQPLSPNTTYWYQVRAYHQLPNGTVVYSAYSNTLQVTTPDARPAAPTGAFMSDVWTFAADVRWTDNADNEDHYNVALSTDGVNFNNVGQAPANGTHFRLPCLMPGTRYWVKVRGCNAHGCSEYTNTAEFVTRPFLAPTSLRASDVYRLAVDLRWDDNADNEDAYRIAISRDGGRNWDNVAEVPANTTSFRVPNLQPNTSYCFQVRGRKDNCGVNVYTEYSNVVCVRTRP